MTPTGLAKVLDWSELVECIGFDRAVLPFLEEAIDNAHVAVVSPTEGRGQGAIVFDYLGFRYELVGRIEHGKVALPVRSIEKIAKVEEVDEDVYFDAYTGLKVSTPSTVVIEDYRMQRMVDSHPEAGSW